MLEMIYLCTVLMVYDGDTFTAGCQVWPGVEVEAHVRIEGIDTPELRSQCDKERALAVDARGRLVQLLDTEEGKVVLRRLHLGKYAGRVVAEVWAEGRNVGETLIREGHARPYDGGTRKSWCTQDGQLTP